MFRANQFRSVAWSKRLFVLVLLLEVGHCATTSTGSHTQLWSNVFQLAMSLVTVMVCLRERSENTSPLGKRSWFYVACAFSIWSLAQVVYIHNMYLPALKLWGRSVDDALWLLIGFPLLLAVNPTLHEVDTVRWLDQLQTLNVFSVLYLLVFYVTGGLSVEHAYMYQNVVLALCCFVRLSAETRGRERRFFVRLALYLGSYAGLGSLGDWLFLQGFPVGTPLDLVWTAPFALFSCLLLRDHILRQEGNGKGEANRHSQSVGNLHSLSVGILPVLSIGASAYLAHHRPVVGYCLLAGAVILFLLRVTKRELTWQSANHSLESALLEDSLTGLGNRVLLRRKLQEIAEQKTSAGRAVLIFADLDKFKSVNDTLGHELGDKLLTLLGQRFLAAAPPDSVVCRLGGDEFIVLTRGTDLAAAELVGLALLDAVRTPVELGRHSVRCTASIGVVLADTGESVDDLLRTADHAMYKAKQSGRNRVTLFDNCWLEDISHRWQIEADLRVAIEEHRIGIVFQPIVDLGCGSILGFEALARWSHPVHGPVPPTDFIQMAEDAGLIGRLGAHVLSSACSQVARWNSLWGRELSISVNVSPRQIADPDLVATVAQVLRTTGLNPRSLKLEITETALLVGMADVKRVLDELRSLGIRISLDDFGTGYSSLSFLLNLPVDEIKLDRSFVSNMQHASERQRIVHKVIQLGQCLDKTIVAEGAETIKDLESLVSMNCQHVQGWIFGRPQNAAWMEEHFQNLRLQILDTIESVKDQSSSFRTASSPIVLSQGASMPEVPVGCQVLALQGE